MRGSREISLVPSLHRASTDALILLSQLYILVATVVLVAAPLPLPMNKSNLHNKEKQLEVHVVIYEELLDLHRGLCFADNY